MNDPMTQPQEKLLLDCPLCKTSEYVGLQRSIRHWPNGQDIGGDNFFCAQCGLATQPTTVPSLACEKWNALVSEINTRTTPNLADTISVLKSIIPNWTEEDWQTFKGAFIKTSDLLAVKRLVERLEAGVVGGSEFEKDRQIKMDYRVFVSRILGSLYGLSTHPTDVPLNGCLISKESMAKINEVYAFVLKERQALDSAMSQTKKGEE